MRNPQVRLSRDQTMLTGAHEATAYRLYELMLLAMKSDSSRDPASSPPRKWRIVRDIAPGAAGVGEEVRAPRGIPEAHVDVAGGTGPGLVRFGHEGDRAAVLVGDLLGAMLVDCRPVGRLEGIGVVDIDLVLARRGLPLGKLDRHPGPGHQVAELAVDRFGLGRLQELVVLVVPAPRPQTRPSLWRRLLRRYRAADRTPAPRPSSAAAPSLRRVRSDGAGSTAARRRPARRSPRRRGRRAPARSSPTRG